MPKQELILVRGVSGSGKSTYVKKNFPTYKHFEADMYHYDKNGVYVWKPENLAIAHKWCQDQVRQALTDGYNVVVSNTSTTRKEVQTYVDIVNDLGLVIDCRVIRMTTRFQNVHNVPDEKVAQMQQKLKDNPWPGEELV